MHNFTLVIKPGSPPVVETPGVDWGRPLEVMFTTSPKFRVGCKVVFRRKGHSSYGGRFSMRDYSQTRYMLVELGSERVTASGSVTGRAFTRTFAIPIEEVEPGPAWRTALAKLIARAQE